MQTTKVTFFSEGETISALWRTPETEGPYPVIVQGPGWLGLKDAKLYVRYHEALVAAGFAVLIFDYRGFGDSGGDRGVLSPARQLQDLVNAVTYVTTRDDVRADAIGTFGTGGTGGGNAVLLAHVDPRIKAAVSQVPVADGTDWLHRMRQEHEWLAFLNSLDEDRKLRVTTGEGRKVHPREEIMVPTPERRTTTIKADVDDRIPSSISLSAAEEILAYRPIDAAHLLTTPLMVIGVAGDATTPTDHAERLYAAAKGPKSLIMQNHTTHYAAYDRYWEQTTPRIVDWFERYV
ncbi:MAG: peptidase, partial [Cryobacterium sp.]|nr:peptidase [Cryobacterium sp.]